MLSRRALGGAVGVLALAGLSACTPQGPVGQQGRPGTPSGRGTGGAAVQITSRHTGAPPKYGEDRVRHDLEPLTKRFPTLGAIVTATWMGGTLSPSGASGPTDQWIDAVIEVTPDAMFELRATEVHAANAGPALVAKVEDALPKGQLSASDELDAVVAPDGDAHVWLVDGTNTLALQYVTR